MKPPSPLTISASASHLISLPGFASAFARQLIGWGGRPASLTVPVLTNSIHIFAVASFGNHAALLGSPLNSAAGIAVSPNGVASHAELRSTGLKILLHSVKRICRQASKNGIARYRESPQKCPVRGSGANPMGAPWARYSWKVAMEPSQGRFPLSPTPKLTIVGIS